MYHKAKKPTPAEPQEVKQTIRMYPLLTLSVDELAEELHISSPTAYDLVKEPDFPSFRIGKRILVNRAALQRWIDQKSEQPLPDFTGDAA